MRLDVFILLIIFGFGLFVYSFYRLRLLEGHRYFSFFGLVLLSIGGSHNLSVRYFKGCVLDPYTFFGIFSFNFADVLVNVGFVLLFLVYIMDFVAKKKEQEV